LRSLLVDPYGRPVEELRISVTQACNYSCPYCHREGEWYEHRQREMKPDEIEAIVRVAVKMGVSKVKLTGGEPLLRKDITDIVARLSGIPGLKDLSLVTNGYFLADMAYDLKDAGLDRVNVSLNTVNPEKYKAITGVDALKRVKEGIEKALDAGLKPLKINYVYLKGFTENCFWPLAEYASKVGVSVLRVIEYHEPPPLSPNYRRFHADLAPLIKEIERIGVMYATRRLQNRPLYLLPGGLVVEIVKPMFNPNFCAACTKLRLTSDGWFKPCLFKSNGLVDALSALKSGENSVEKALIKATLRREPFFKRGKPFHTGGRR